MIFSISEVFVIENMTYQIYIAYLPLGLCCAYFKQVYDAARVVNNSDALQMLIHLTLASHALCNGFTI